MSQISKKKWPLPYFIAIVFTTNPLYTLLKQGFINNQIITSLGRFNSIVLFFVTLKDKHLNWFWVCFFAEVPEQILFYLTWDLQQLVLSSILVHLWVQSVLSLSISHHKMWHGTGSFKPGHSGQFMMAHRFHPFSSKLPSFDKICSDMFVCHRFSVCVFALVEVWHKPIAIQ